MAGGVRKDAPALWTAIVAWCREMGIDWPEDDIAAVIGKVRAPSADRLPDDIEAVLLWAKAAQASSDEDARATVEVWRTTPADLIEITVEGGQVQHRLSAGPARH